MHSCNVFTHFRAQFDNLFIFLKVPLTSILSIRETFSPLCIVEKIPIFFSEANHGEKGALQSYSPSNPFIDFILSRILTDIVSGICFTVNLNNPAIKESRSFFVVSSQYFIFDRPRYNYCVATERCANNKRNTSEI